MVTCSYLYLCTYIYLCIKLTYYREGGTVVLGVLILLFLFFSNIISHFPCSDFSCSPAFSTVSFIINCECNLMFCYYIIHADVNDSLGIMQSLFESLKGLLFKYFFFSLYFFIFNITFIYYAIILSKNVLLTFRPL